MTEIAKTDDPVHTNLNLYNLLFTYRLPLAGIISILHRISGALLFLCLPLLLYLFNRSLTSELTFAAFSHFVSHIPVKLVLIVLIWAYVQHLTGGVRHLFMDVHMGLEKDQARYSASAVLAISLVITLVIALKLFGAF